jgi:ubiquinone/menaquinone biosynthesis C-methylase UbiE
MLREQAEYFDRGVDENFELNRPHGESRFYRFLMRYKVRRAFQLLREPIHGKTVLVLCCGSGMDAEIIANQGAIVSGIDVSLGALKRARARSERYGTRYQLIRADAQSLPFGHETFDYSFVHDGLHHLPDPNAALAEMARVSRSGVLLVEPADAGLTNLAVRLGILPLKEEAGNVVLRLNPASVSSQLRSLGYGRQRSERYLVRYGHPPGRWWHLFDHTLAFEAAKAAFFVLGVRVFGRWGNKLVFVAERRVCDDVDD